LILNEILEIEQKAKVLDLFADIAIFYSQSMTQPFVAVLGILTVILFFVIVLK